MSWPLNAVNAHASAANEVSAGAADHCRPQPDRAQPGEVTALVVELEARSLRTGNDVPDCLGARDDRLDGRLESREVARTADRTEHASFAVEIDALGDIRPGEPHETLPEVSVRLVPGGNYCGIGSQAASIQRQRALAIEVMKVGHGAIVSSQHANSSSDPSQLSNPGDLLGHGTSHGRTRDHAVHQRAPGWPPGNHRVGASRMSIAPLPEGT